jgi:dTDP-glucose 4,6-dehydratase
VIPKTIWCGLTGRKLPLQGGGSAQKSYIHARDLARAIYLVSEKAEFNKIYNVGPAEPISIRSVVEMTARSLGIAFEELCEVTEDRLGQDARYWLDSSRIQKELGWKPEISWEEGLKEMVSWGKEFLPEIRNLSPDYIMRG